MSTSRHLDSRRAAAAIVAEATACPVACSVSDFIKLLFTEFEKMEIEYCVLHGWDELPEGLSSDLDLAVHLKGRDKVPAVLGKMRNYGFLPVDCHNYEVNGRTFYFCWFQGTERRCIAVDIIFEYRGNGTIVLSSDQLTADRRRYRSFWIPGRAQALRYLLAKRTMKKQFAPHQQYQIKRLLFELGMTDSEAVAATLFGEKSKRQVVEAALGDRLDSISDDLGKAMTRTSLRRKPLTAVRCLIGEGFRLLRRVMRPTGALIAIMGPDGAGKSTLIQDLMEREWLEFQSCRAFHWRPQFIGKKPDLGPLSNPHGIPPRGPLASLLRLAGFFADYWLGYMFVVRPLLVRSGLVIFDRYFDDITIDNKRYRYGGPSWAPKFLAHLIPRPDMIVVLDADVERVLARKREVRADEMVQLRKRYLEFARLDATCQVISTEAGVLATSAATSRALAACMYRRFELRLGRWMTRPHSSPAL